MARWQWHDVRRLTTTGTTVGGIAVLLLASCGPAGTGDDASPAPPASADHHVHIRSQAAADHQDALMTALGERPPGDTVPLEGIATADVIAALDSAGVEAAIVVSNAYMYGMPEVRSVGQATATGKEDAPRDPQPPEGAGDSPEDEAALVREENEYLAQEVAKFPDRLVGFCSVNPTRPYALTEVERCAADARIGGLKLHLANSDVDLRDSVQVQALADLFALANRSRLPILIHMRTRQPAYGEPDARAMIERVLSRSPDLPVIVAHMAGWGGYDDATDAALAAFVAAREAGQLGQRVMFGLGAVVFEPRAAGADTARAAQVREANRRLAERIRQLGPDRVVYATDWPAWPPGADPVGKIAANRQLLRDALPLDPAELNRIFANVSPAVGWIRPAPTKAR